MVGDEMVKGSLIRDNEMTLQRRIDFFSETDSRHDIDVKDSISSLIDLYNWPTTHEVGHTVRYMYHLMLDDHAKIERITEDLGRFTIYFEHDDRLVWVPKKLILTPRPER